MEAIPINYLPVFIAAIANMGLGFLWYGPLFGKEWRQIMGFTKDGMRSMTMTPLKASIGGFIGALLMAIVLAHVLVFASSYINISGLPAGLAAGFWLWLGFVAPVTMGVVLWEGKPWKLWFINSGYYFVALLVMGAIISIWL